MYGFMEGGGARLLMVLDACRLDYFVKHMATLSDAGISKTVPAASAGSCTREWFENTFVEPMRDVVYISANPKLSTKPLRDRLHRCFSKVIEVWRFAWDEKLGTVRAGKVSEAVKIALRRGAKKVIAHYMQPHAPFVCDTWLNVLYDRSLMKGVEVSAYELARINPVARKEFIRAYDQNVAYVMGEAAKLIRSLMRRQKALRVAITSDHGECLGRWIPLVHLRKEGVKTALRLRRRTWKMRAWRALLRAVGAFRTVGHDCGLLYPELIYVPWATTPER